MSLSDEFKAELQRAAREDQCSEAELISRALEDTLARRAGPKPRLGLGDSGDPAWAGRVDEALEGFGG